jgi:hypothetical protein
MRRAQLQYVPFLYNPAALPPAVPASDEPWPLDDETARASMLLALQRERSSKANKSLEEKKGVGGFLSGLVEKVIVEVGNGLSLSADDLRREQDAMRHRFGSSFALLAHEVFVFGFSCSLVAPIAASPTAAAELVRGECYVTERSLCFSSESFNVCLFFFFVSFSFLTCLLSTRSPLSRQLLPMFLFLF